MCCDAVIEHPEDIVTLLNCRLEIYSDNDVVFDNFMDSQENTLNFCDFLISAEAENFQVIDSISYL